MSYAPHVSQIDVPASPREIGALRNLLVAYQRAERDLQVAFTQFCAAHEIGDGATLKGLSDTIVRVEVTEAATERTLRLEP